MRIGSTLFAIFLGSCSGQGGFLAEFDRISFQIAGGTLFSSPSLVTSKEIHFDSGLLSGRDVIIEGHIQSVGRYGTYLVLTDEFGRLLVVLTQIDGLDRKFGSVVPEKIRIWGTVERGKKGLPFILAKSVLVPQDG